MGKTASKKKAACAKTATKKSAAIKKKTAKKAATTKSAAKKKATKKVVSSAARAETKADEALVERTLALVATQTETEEAGRLAIGEHVLEQYFGGDAELALSHSPVKPKSFAALARRADDEYGWDEHDFRFAVRVAVAYRSLTPSVRIHIPASTLARLASIEDLGVRGELAAKIASGELRGHAARDAIARAGAHEARGGRPVLPAALREGRRIVRAVLRADANPSFDARSLRELDDAQKRELAEQIDDAVAKLRALATALRHEE